MKTLVWEGEVEQTTDGDHRVQLHKERWEIETTPALGLVRKHLPDGPTRPPVLLVHGFAQNRYSWHSSSRSMSAWLAAQGWDTWNLELRGHGHSRSEQGRGAESFGDYVDDVLRALRALEGRAFLVGHSLGGAACYGAAALTCTEQRAPRPLGVVGIGAIYHFGQANPTLGLLTRLTHRVSESPLVVAGATIRTRLLGRALGRLYALSDPLGYTSPLSGWWPGSIEPAILAERLEHGFDWTSVKVWLEMSRWGASQEFEYEPAWSQTDLPLLVLLGDEDRLVPPADGRVAFDRSGSTDKELVLLDQLHHETHWGHLDLIFGRHAPAQVWAPIDAWMQPRSLVD